MPFSTPSKPQPHRLPCSAAAVAVLILCSGVLGFSIARDLAPTCPTVPANNAPLNR